MRNVTVPPHRRTLLRAAAVAVVLAVAARQGWLAYERRAAQNRISASGSVEATEVDVGPKVPGRVTHLFAQEGDTVRAGQVLAQMDDQDPRAALDAAVAKAAAARAALIKAGKDLQRTQELLAAGAVAAQQLDQAKVDYDAAQAQDRSAQDDVARARQNLASFAAIVAPSDGVILTRSVQPGEVVAAGTPLYTLVNPNDIWLRAFIPEDRVGRVRLGLPADVMVDTFPGRTLPGRVIEISHRAEFTPGNVQTKEDRVKLVFAVKIRLDNRDGSLKPGMPADAVILLDRPPAQ